MARSRKPVKARKEKGRMQLYDVRVIDTSTGEIIDQRCLDCSCWLFEHWWANDLVNSHGQPYPAAALIEISPR
jgi:hypothetical protein